MTSTKKVEWQNYYGGHLPDVTGICTSGISLWSIILSAQGFNKSKMRSTGIKVSSKTKPCNKRQLEVLINYLL